MRQQYNLLYLKGYRHVDDLVYCKEHGIDVSLAYTPGINQAYIDKDKNNSREVKRLLANNGLLNGDANEEKL